MFTGIVEEVGAVLSTQDRGSNRDIVVKARLAAELRIDQSVSHNGVCLTVVELFTDPGSKTIASYRVTAVKETLERSNIGSLKPGAIVGLERSLRLGDRLDGHMVQGHVDTTVECIRVEEMGGSWIFSFALPEQKHLLVHKGSVCINGVSLTIASLDARSFGVAIIPYTFEHTTFRTLKVGMAVNIEYDVVGKYVARMLGERLTP